MSIEPSKRTLPPDSHSQNAKHRGSRQPALREKTLFRTIIRRLVDGISISAHDFDSKAEARRRAELERCDGVFAASPSSPYGCVTLRVNQEYCDIPTLSRQSGLRTVRDTTFS